MRRLTAAVVALVAFGPLCLLATGSFSGSWYWPALLPQSWSLRAWEYVFSPSAEILGSLGTSLFIALTVACFSLLLAIPAARALALHRFRGKTLVLWSLLLPIVAPPLASTMGLHRMLLVYGLTDTIAGVVLAHLVPAMPYAALMLGGSFLRFDPDYEAQARTLGASRFSVWRHVTLPAIAPGIAVAFALAFLVSWSQYLLTSLIGGGRVLTLPLQLIAFARGGDEAITAALSLVFIAPAVAVISLSRRLAGGRPAATLR